MDEVQRKIIEGYLWTTDVEGRMNDCGWGLARWLGATPSIVMELQELVVHPDDRARYVASFAEAFAMREEWKSQVRIRRADLRWIWSSVSGRPLCGGVTFQGYRCVTVPLDLINPSLSSGSQADAE